MLYFISHNQHKVQEAKEILMERGIEIEPFFLEIKELQSTDLEEIACDKARKAFKKLRRPILIEHTGLLFDRYPGFPGGLTQIVWDSLKADSFCKLFHGEAVHAVSTIAYCDGKEIHCFSGEVKGKIAETPSGISEFQWDPVFIPENSSQTFAEMERPITAKSMRRNALDKFAEYWEETNGSNRGDQREAAKK